MQPPPAVRAQSAPRPLRRDAEQNRMRILEAARVTFAAKGLEATLDDVARQAGVGIGTVYRRFPTKESLVDAALSGRMADLVELATESTALLSAWEGTMLFLRRGAEYLANDRGLRDIALSRGTGSAIVDHMHREVQPLIESLITRAKDEGELRRDVDFQDLFLVLYMVSEVAYRSAALWPQGYLRYLELMIDGLRADAAHGDLGVALPEHDREALMARLNPLQRR